MFFREFILHIDINSASIFYRIKKSDTFNFDLFFGAAVKNNEDQPVHGVEVLKTIDKEKIIIDEGYGFVNFFTPANVIQFKEMFLQNDSLTLILLVNFFC